MLLSRPQKYHVPVRICSPIIQHKKSMSCSYAETRRLTFLVTTCFSLNSLSLWNILCWQQRLSASPPVLSVYCCHGWQVLTSASFTPCRHGFFSHSCEWFLKHQKEPDREDLKSAFERSTHTLRPNRTVWIFFFPMNRSIPQCVGPCFVSYGLFCVRQHV